LPVPRSGFWEVAAIEILIPGQTATYPTTVPQKKKTPIYENPIAGIPTD
jgi:hypothetical protein